MGGTYMGADPESISNLELGENMNESKCLEHNAYVVLERYDNCLFCGEILDDEHMCEEK